MGRKGTYTLSEIEETLDRYGFGYRKERWANEYHYDLYVQNWQNRHVMFTLGFYAIPAVSVNPVNPVQEDIRYNIMYEDEYRLLSAVVNVMEVNAYIYSEPDLFARNY